MSTDKLEAGPQAPAAGEEIMVNAAHDVFTLPLQPSGLSSGPRFVVHVPGPEQTAAPDVEALVEALKCMIIGACAVAVPHNGERAVLQDAVNIARAALAAYRQRGD